MPDDQYIVIGPVRNVADLVSKQGGAAGGIAMSLAPQTISNKVYEEMRKKIAEGFSKEGVVADVKVVSNRPAGGGPSQDLWVGLGVGAGVVGFIGLVKYLITRRK